METAGDAVMAWIAEYFQFKHHLPAERSSSTSSSSNVMTGRVNDGTAFSRVTGGDGSVPSQKEEHHCIHWGLEWQSTMNNIPPVFLQHHSHSRTVIGVSSYGGEMHLIILDPAKRLTCADVSSADLSSLKVTYRDLPIPSTVVSKLHTTVGCL